MLGGELSLRVCYFLRAVTAPYHGLGGFPETYFFVVLEAGSPKSKCWHVETPLLCWQRTPGTPRGPFPVDAFLPIRTPVLSDHSPNPVSSFNLNYLF